MNWLVVGAGDIAKKRVIPAILSDKRCRVAGVCDLVEARARELAAPCGARAFTDFAAALADPAVEAVYLSTPVFLHAPQAVEALQAGKHVIVEKPLGLNAADAQRVVDAAAGAKGRCGVAYFRRFTPRYRHLKELLDKGTLGQVVLVRMCYFSWFNPDRDDPKYWRVVPERSGGGPLSDMGTHMFDLLIDAFGMPTAVQARVERLTHLYGVEDSAVMTMKLACGAQADASFHWNSRTWSHEFEVVGTEAKVKWHPYDAGPVQLTVGRETKSLELPGADNVHAPLIADFVDAVESGHPPAITPEQGLLTNRLLDAVYRSAWEKSVVVP